MLSVQYHLKTYVGYHRMLQSHRVGVSFVSTIQVFSNSSPLQIFSQLAISACSVPSWDRFVATMCVG